MKKIFISSPLRGDIEGNIQKVKKYCADVIRTKHLPIAPHLYFTQFLADNNKKERQLGIRGSLELLKLCDELHVYTNTNGIITEGMRREVRLAEKLGKKIVYRKIPFLTRRQK